MIFAKKGWLLISRFRSCKMCYCAYKNLFGVSILTITSLPVRRELTGLTPFATQGF